MKVYIDDPKKFDFDAHANELCGVLLQTPDTNGVLHDYKPLIDKVKAANKNIYAVLACDLLALTITRSASEMGADIAVGTSQRFGVPMCYGGPHAAFMATKDEYKRKMPGRVIGISKDSHGNKAYRMSLQTREQHIRREKATSNICTAQALLANISAMYTIYHGPNGLKKIATRVNALTQTLAAALKDLGFKLIAGQDGVVNYFDTITIQCDAGKAGHLLDHFYKASINLRQISDSLVAMSLDETTTLEELESLVGVFAEYKGKKVDFQKYVNMEHSHIGIPFERQSTFLTQKVFNTLHSEHQMLRYLHFLQNKDISLAKSMIPLGSCTMKLNASCEMYPITWPEFSNVHPFTPVDQAKGYAELLKELSSWLKTLTGFEAFCLQPNSGAQGEYTGLLTIMSYFKAKGDIQRNICLIPVSAHGTNPASAIMAGLKVVPVKADAKGNIDLEDLAKQAEKHSKNLAVLMATYPSTHGVYEDTITEAIKIVHNHGGQVYMDGANMNAQVGWTSPGFLGADVCHLNLHKTFSIPHGGGGPGMGPIGVRAHLGPYLPSHPLIPCGGEKSFGSVSSAPWGSGGILPISYVYIACMGKVGLKKATAVAILGANYIATRLKDHYPILYTGRRGLVAHEFILDMRPLKEATGISEEDVAKRLMDFGFHGPTMSFPVPGTLMIEPTESEDKGEMDRLCEAFIQIRREIEMVKNGTYDKKDNPLKGAPHTAEHVTSSKWNHKYTREEAAYPLPWVAHRGKFWPSVGRIDNPFGDRNLVCTCPPTTDYMDEVK